MMFFDEASVTFYALLYFDNSENCIFFVIDSHDQQSAALNWVVISSLILSINLLYLLLL